MQPQNDTLIENFDNTILIISGLDDDPLCDEIRMLAAASRNKVNGGRTHRPDAPVVKAPREKSRAVLVLQGVIKWAAGLPRAIFRGKKPAAARRKPWFTR